MAEQEMAEQEFAQQEMGGEEMSQESSVPDHEPDAPSSEICALSSEPCEEPGAPSSAPNSQHLRFPDRQENSDKHLAEVATEALFDPRYEEARGEVLAAVAAPLDQLMEEEALAVGAR
jgi:hypothetical protein